MKYKIAQILRLDQETNKTIKECQKMNQKYIVNMTASERSQLKDWQFELSKNVLFF